MFDLRLLIYNDKFLSLCQCFDLATNIFLLIVKNNWDFTIFLEGLKLLMNLLSQKLDELAGESKQVLTLKFLYID